MSRILIPLFGVLLFGCNQSLRVQKYVSIDDEIAPYVQEFVDAAARAGHKVVIDDLYAHFNNHLDVDVLGQCSPHSRGIYGTPEIELSTEDRLEMEYILKKQLVFHEMAHCVLWLDHDETWINMGPNYIPYSIMYPSIQEAYIYNRYWDYYENELFNGP